MLRCGVYVKTEIEIILGLLRRRNDLIDYEKELVEGNEDYKNKRSFLILNLVVASINSVKASLLGKSMNNKTFTSILISRCYFL